MGRYHRILPVLLLLFAAAGCATARTVDYSVQSSIADPALAHAQRAVWESWFAGDTAQLRKLTPGLVAMEGRSYENQEETIAGSARFHADGGRLLRLSFSDMRVTRYGNVAIVYSTVTFTTANGDKTTDHVDRATEVFVLDKGKWVNPGWHLENINP